MATAIFLPECLLQAYKLMFPTLDFSRIHFFEGIPFPFDFGSNDLITTASLPDNINIYIKEGTVDPCSLNFFADLGHELVHALQAEKGLFSGELDSWNWSYLTAAIGTFSTGRDRKNPYEKEAYDFEDRIRTCGFVPCTCGKRIPWITATPDLAGQLTRCRLIKAQPEADWTQAAGATVGGIADALHDNGVTGTIWFGIASLVALIVSIIYGIIDAIVGIIKGIVDAIGNFFKNLFGVAPEGHLNLLFSTDDGLSFGDKATLEKSTEQPALAFGPGQLFLGWTGTDNQVNVLVTPDPTKTTFEKSHDDGPALAFGNGRLFVAWQGTDNRLNVISSGDGKNFGNKVTLGETSPDNATPGLMFGDGRLYLAWVGNDHRLNILSSPDGLIWGSKITLGDTTGDDGTAAITFGNGRLFLAWAGTDNAHTLNVMALSHDVNGVLTPQTKVTLQEQCASRTGPALAFGDGLLYVSWTGTDNSLNVLSSADGQNFGSKRTFEKSSDQAGPGLAFGGGVLCISWVGQG